MTWFDSLPPADATVPCGNGTHTLRWEAGRLEMPAHPDIEAELVLGALGGEKPACLTVSQAWADHADDLAVLSAGPRSAADRVTVTWDQVARQRTHGEEGRIELFELLALGPAFQFRLSGAVAAAWAGPARARDRAAHGPRLTAALSGRFAPAAADWLGIDPDAVTITPHEGPGWGSLSLTGTGSDRRLTGCLPVSWLSGVWACGLAVVGGHLVVAVERAGYPRARVLALRAPDADPVILDIEATSRGGAADTSEADGDGALPRWQNR
jgi:hypothetical protein